MTTPGCRSDPGSNESRVLAKRKRFYNTSRPLGCGNQIGNVYGNASMTIRAIRKFFFPFTKIRQKQNSNIDFFLLAFTSSKSFPGSVSRPFSVYERFKST